MKTLRAYYQDQYENFLHYFKKTMEDQDMEDIHQMRVSIKKLRAIWSLMEVISDFNWSKRPHYKQVAPLFKTAGSLRETQVNLELANQYKAGGLKTYRKFLQKKEAEANQNLVAFMGDYSLDKLDKLNEAIPPSIFWTDTEMIQQKTIDHTAGILHQVKQLQQELPNTKKLHKIRIQLKAVQEILFLISELAGTTVEKLQNKVKAINKRIGKWHDYVEFVKSIALFVKIRQKKKISRPLSLLIRRIEEKQKSRAKKLQKLLKRNLPQNELIITNQIAFS